MGTITTFPAAAPSIPVSGTHLAYAQRTTSLTGAAAGTDVPELTATVVVPDGRRIRLSAFGQVWNSGTYMTNGLRIMEGTTVLQESTNPNEGTGSANEVTCDPSVVVTPTAGVHTYKVQLFSASGTPSLNASATQPAYLLVEDITNTPQPYPAASVPVGQLAYGETTADITGVTTGVGVVATLNVTVAAGRTIRLRGEITVQSSAIDDQILLNIRQDGTVVRYREVRPTIANVGESFSIEMILSPSAGAHTYVFDFSRGFNATGTLSAAGTGTRRGHLIIEDITPTPAPANTAPSSTLGYAEVTAAAQAGITTAVDLTGLSVTVTVPAGRRIRVTGHVAMTSSVAGDTGEVYIYEDGTRKATATETMGSNANGAQSFDPAYVASPSAGTHTYKLVAVRSMGTGSMTAWMGSGYPGFILVEDITGASVPVPGAELIGAVLAYAGSVAPLGWLVCDGAALDTAAYPALFAVIGYTYGGSGTTFNLPNLKGRVAVGRDAADTDWDVLGETRGTKTHTLTEAQIPSHDHAWGGINGAVMVDSSGGDGSANRYTVAVGTSGGPTWNTDGAGSGGAHNIIQPSLVLNYIIRALP